MERNADIKKMLDALKASAQALNQIRNTTLSGEYKNSYEVAALVGRVIREVENK